MFMMSTRSLSVSSLFLVCYVLYASIAMTKAQTSSTGAISGIVFDRTGAVVPGALISLSPRDGTYLRSSKSNSDGSFMIASIRPGTYELRVDKANFKPLAIRVVHIRVAGTIRLELH